MNIEVNGSLKLIYEEVLRRCERQTVADKFGFMALLRTMTTVERMVIAKLFCKLPWNVGSLYVLSALQELRIITATEFILSLRDPVHTQLILNDFLEAEYLLLCNLFITAYYDTSNSVKLNSMLDECLRRLFSDLLHKPDICNLNYLATVQCTLPPDLVLNVAQKHIDAVFELHSSSAKEAFRQFSAWINEGVDEIKFTKDLYKNLLRHAEKEVISYMLKVSTMEHFKLWKFYLILLQTIASNCTEDTAAHMRKYFKTRFRQVASMGTRTAMLHLLLTIRAATATTMDIHKNLNAYADFYKENVSDMKFVLSIEEFQNALALLDKCIDYESEKNYLEIHKNISISPPVMCGKLVHAYKAKCKLRLSQLKIANGTSPVDESIVIDDD